jgi:hypothetical protein
MIVTTQYTDLHRRNAESDALRYFESNSTAKTAYYICFGDGRVQRVEGSDYWVLSIENQSVVTIENPQLVSSDKHFRYSQNEPSQIWQIHHGLGKYPSVSIVDSAKSAVIGEVQYLDENRLVVSFSAAFSGEAFLN